MMIQFKLIYYIQLTDIENLNVIVQNNTEYLSNLKNSN